MVTELFTLIAAFAANFGKSAEAGFDPRELVAKIASRGDACNEIRPLETAQIRAIPRFWEPCPVEMPLVHSTVDISAW